MKQSFEVKETRVETELTDSLSLWGLSERVRADGKVT